ncbi:MAG: hypothetical protein ACTSXA_00675 [Candidatus Heimdallarchaeota archaeon]
MFWRKRLKEKITKLEKRNRKLEMKIFNLNFVEDLLKNLLRQQRQQNTGKENEDIETELNMFREDYNSPDILR